MLPQCLSLFLQREERGKGTGTGVSVIYGIVKQCGGWITVTSSKGAARIFCSTCANETRASLCRKTLSRCGIPSTLPGSARTSCSWKTSRVSAISPHWSAGAGYKVCLHRGRRGQGYFAESTRGSLLFSDVVLIGQNGIDLALDLRRQTPALPCLLCSGYADDTVRWDSIQKEGFHFLPKPYPVAKLLSAVIEALTDAAP
jgi:two-component system cell cycle sensor histidine kinase/response regulator CckA